VAAFFLVGYPGETVASIEETFKLALSLPLDEISFNVPFPRPGPAYSHGWPVRNEGEGRTQENDGHLRLPSEIERALAAAPDRRDLKASRKGSSERSPPGLYSGPEHPLRRLLEELQCPRASLPAAAHLETAHVPSVSRSASALGEVRVK